MRYMPKVRTNAPETLAGLQPGQWIDYNGALGRFMGVRHGIHWIAWDSTARRRFSRFAAVYNAA